MPGKPPPLPGAGPQAPAASSSARGLANDAPAIPGASQEDPPSIPKDDDDGASSQSSLKSLKESEANLDDRRRSSIDPRVLQMNVMELADKVRSVGAQLSEVTMERDAAAEAVRRLQAQVGLQKAETVANKRALASLRWKHAREKVDIQRLNNDNVGSVNQRELSALTSAEATALQAQLDALKRERIAMEVQISQCKDELGKGKPTIEELRDEMSDGMMERIEAEIKQKVMAKIEWIKAERSKAERIEAEKQMKAKSQAEVMAEMMALR